jgi:hypothetical protein
MKGFENAYNCSVLALQLLFRLDQPHGPGDTFINWQHGSGGFFATTGADQSVMIYNHHGKKVEQIRLQGYG